MKLLLKDAKPDWDGTAFVSLECDVSRAEAQGIGEITKGWDDAYVSIEGKKTSVGARIRHIAPGKGVLIIDRYLRRDLNLPENCEVEVKPLAPRTADEVQFGIPEEYIASGECLESCRTYLTRQPLSRGQIKPIFLFRGQEVPVEIEEVIPEDMSIFTRKTESNTVSSKASVRGFFFDDIAGLDHEIHLIRERVELPIKHAEKLSSLGIYPPRGVLLSGPPGCGKTMIARALGNEIGAEPFEISGPEIYAPVYGESEKQLREIFVKAKDNAPSLILIDEIDSIGISRQSSHGELERRIVTTLLTEMDGLRDMKNVIVVATTNNPDALDPALRRPGRFDYEIRIGIPDVRGREAILGVHTRRMSLAEDVDLSYLARVTHGYTGADLGLLCREAAYCTLRRVFPEGIFSEDEVSKVSELEITLADFEVARKRISPSAMREFLIEIPSMLSWEDVGGLEQVKKTLIEEVVKSITNPEAFEKLGINPVQGILLYGPPGTGKTLLAKIIANQAGANFISVRGPEIFSKWFGESEQRVRHIFLKAREVSPCIIFFDEIDAITAQRGKSISDAADRVVNQLLTEMDGIENTHRVCVIAATNRKELIDPAFLRPGRFDYHIYVPLPDKASRYQIFHIHLKGKRISEGIDLELLVDESEGFSGAHIAEVCRRAGMQALREADFDGDLAQITMQHLREAINTVKFSIKELEKPVVGFKTSQ